MLENVNSPKDVKELNIKELEELSADIRALLLEKISQTGGHLGSNLGVVELTIAIHKYFNSPQDKIIFDVGHQSYVHKILTGRKDMFDTLRQYGGLSGFIKFEESIHDVWEAGHSSTSISGSMGYAISNGLDNKDDYVICVIGDGSLTNGLSLEALNHLCDMQSKVIIILNDNEMSISQNVGFIDKVLKNLHNNKEYKDTKDIVKNNLNKTQVGASIAKAISISKNKMKKEFVNEAHNFFDMIGFDYIGPFDGHSFDDLDKAFAKAKSYDTPVIVHVKTRKGKGYGFAESEKWHGVGPFDINSGKMIKESKGLSYSKFVAENIYQRMEEDKDVVVITPAMLGGSELEKLKSKFPKRVYDVGIAEEHAVTLSAGLAIAHKKPFLSIYSTFLQRGYDEVFHDIVRQKANVVIGIDRAGLVGEDGETHQGIYDISFLYHMHDLVIMQANDESALTSVMDFAFDYQGPVAIRYPKGGQLQVINSDNSKLEFGKWLYNGIEKLNILAYGDMYNLTCEVVQEMNLSSVEVVNTIFIKPLDSTFLKDAKNSQILVIEEHTSSGSLASQITDYYNDNEIPKVIYKLNLKDEFIVQGNVNKLREVYKIDKQAMKDKINYILNK